ncbi:hypothetical protein MKW94_014424, partial [Papaver nudicaule]|nr:hypothetical protein [Papaver nudicaule]
MGRGPGKMPFLHDLEPCQRLPVEVDMDLLCPVGDNETFLTKFISYLAKDGNKLPLTVHDWKYMDAQLIENVILEIK